jgi:hypothetical protein
MAFSISGNDTGHCGRSTRGTILGQSGTFFDLARINLMIGDARNFLLLSKEKYDLITIEQDFTQILQPGVEGSAAPVHKLKPLLI